MNIRRFTIVFILALIGILYFLNRKDISLVKQDSFEVVSIGNEGYMLKSVIHLHNPNLLSSTVKTISENFYVNGNKLAIMNMEIEQGIPGMKETEFPVNIRFGKADIESLLSDTSTHTIKAGVNVKGEIAFQNLFAGGTITVDQQDSVTITK
jgi:LEA14-like dessication related protein